MVSKIRSLCELYLKSPQTTSGAWVLKLTEVIGPFAQLRKPTDPLPRQLSVYVCTHTILYIISSCHCPLGLKPSQLTWGW